MSSSFKKFIFFLFLLTFISIIGSKYVFSIPERKNIEANKNQQKANIRTEIATAVNKMALKYNTHIEWYKFILGRPYQSIYSIEIEKNLIEISGRPILAFGVVRDIYTKDNKNYAQFISVVRSKNPESDSNNYNEFIFEIECNMDQTKLLMQKYPLKEKYAIIIKVNSFEKIYKKVDEEDTMVIMAYGSCLDILSVSEYYDHELWL